MMVINGWTNVRAKSDLIHYVKNYHHGDGDASLFIYLQDYAVEVWGKKKSDWMVSTDNHRGKTRDYRFRTKKEAVKFANDYMRLH